MKEITDVVVSSKYRGNNFCKLLINKVLDYFKDYNFKIGVIASKYNWTNINKTDINFEKKGNIPALKCYIANGFIFSLKDKKNKIPQEPYVFLDNQGLEAFLYKYKHNKKKLSNDNDYLLDLSLGNTILKTKSKKQTKRIKYKKKTRKKTRKHTKKHN